jgi:hypothetical protein
MSLFDPTPLPPTHNQSLPSQDCNLDTLRRVTDACRYYPRPGYRKHLILVDEADQMSKAAQLYLLSKLDATAMMADVWSTEAPANAPLPNFARIAKEATGNVRAALMTLQNTRFQPMKGILICNFSILTATRFFQSTLTINLISIPMNLPSATTTLNCADFGSPALKPKRPSNLSGMPAMQRTLHRTMSLSANVHGAHGPLSIRRSTISSSPWPMYLLIALATSTKHCNRPPNYNSLASAKIGNYVL